MKFSENPPPPGAYPPRPHAPLFLTNISGGGRGADDEVTRHRATGAQAPSAVRSPHRGPWEARRHRITPHRVPGGGYSPVSYARCARGRRAIGLGGTGRRRCRYAVVRRTHAPVRSSPCAHISQGPRGFLACDQQRRVGQHTCGRGVGCGRRGGSRAQRQDNSHDLWPSSPRGDGSTGVDGASVADARTPGSPPRAARRPGHRR
jgi:hypothetical protein